MLFRSPRARGPVEILDRHDVGHLRRGHIGKGRIRGRVLGLAEIGHDRQLPAVIGEIRVVLVGDGRTGVVVRALVVQPDGVAELVDKIGRASCRERV